MQLIGSVFKGGGKDGDFGWMIQQSEYADALFIFNDNEEQYLAHRNEPEDPSGCAPGGGNAIIRSEQCKDPPRAAGIPTGANGRGYAALNAHVQRVIDDAVSEIRRLVASGLYQRIIYSAANEHGELGTGIFNVAEDVKRYIVEQLRKVANK